MYRYSHTISIIDYVCVLHVDSIENLMQAAIPEAVMASIVTNNHSSHSGSLLTKLLHEITGQTLRQGNKQSCLVHA